MNALWSKDSYLTLVQPGLAKNPDESHAGVAACSTAGDRETADTAPPPINILLVEDNPADRRLVMERLSNCRREFNLVCAGSLGDALLALSRNKISIILLDLQLPDCRDLDSLTRIHAAAPGTPIVVLSEIEDEALALKTLQHGAQDFLVKWHTNEHLLVRALQYALERKQVEEHLYHLAHHDTLTGLPNRKLFYSQLKRALAMARRNGLMLAVMFLDLCEFKKINDNLGHCCGDILLQTVARRLAASVRETDCIARVGGDEFIVAFTISNPEDASIAAAKLLESFDEPFALGSHSFRTHASLGISLYPSDAEDMENLIRNADLAMYQAKAEGRDASRFWFYSPELNTKYADLMRAESQMRQALENGEFVIHYQPQVDIHHGKLVGMEALLRWQHPEDGLLMPARFMSTLEESGFIVEAGAWGLREACKQNKAWQQAGHPPLVMAVNISSQELWHTDFIATLKSVLDETGLEPRWLELEIREQSIEKDEELAAERLTAINALGVRIALDNLGHSHIPLSFLTRFPIHAIKIDRSIVSDIATDANHASITKAVIAIARVLNIKGLAEGVETREQLDFLKTEHCDDAQGYMFGKPLPPADCIGLMQRLKSGHCVLT
jgi:diguanylate cyclase (GGDEF)-like protein